MKEIERKKYAELLVKIGINLQPGQVLVLQTNTDGMELARAVTEAAFVAGAKDVIVHIEDADIRRLRAKYVDIETLREVPEWKKESLDYYFRQKGCQLGIMGTYPTLFDGIDNEKVMTLSAAENELRNVVRHHIHNGNIQWNGNVHANKDWAKKVYPELPEDEAYTKLEDALLTMVRVKDVDDPIKAWADHCERLAKISDKLNSYNFDFVHITTGIGTDIKIRLAKNHIWGSAGQTGAETGLPVYIANIPTEEIYTDPDRRYVDGVAVAALPLMLNGKLIEDFSITFKDGLAVECEARTNEDVLKEALFKDDCTRRLGEVAFVSKHSPIRQMGRVFYNTLLDENAASHLAFGTSFPSCVKGAATMTTEELLEHGINVASCHTDFMIGTDDMKAVGTTFDGTEVVIMDDGDFVI